MQIKKEIIGNSRVSLGIPIDLDNPEVLRRFIADFLAKLPDIVEQEVIKARAKGGFIDIKSDNSGNCTNFSHRQVATCSQIQRDMPHRLKDDGSVVSFKPQRYKTDLTFTDDKQMVSKKYVDDIAVSTNFLKKDGSVISEAVQNYAGHINSFTADSNLVNKGYVDDLVNQDNYIPKSGQSDIFGVLRYTTNIPVHFNLNTMITNGMLQNSYKHLKWQYSSSDFGNKQIFTADDTFTVPAGVYRLLTMMCGGGGGGVTTESSDPYSGYWDTQGGAGAGMFVGMLQVVPGQQVEVRIGAGGAGQGRGGATTVGILTTEGAGQYRDRSNEGTAGVWARLLTDTVTTLKPDETDYIVHQAENINGVLGPFTAKTISTIDLSASNEGIPGGVGGVWDFIDDVVYGGVNGHYGQVNATGYGCGGASYWSTNVPAGQGKGSPGIAIIRW